mmetsp:Transcript_21603/g.55188  ORF Transcript_21603/g.55188 Transcript_21603/m.55188 type:complete len:236 (+) Transcript_21603:387-1094(+)
MNMHRASSECPMTRHHQSCQRGVLVEMGLCRRKSACAYFWPKSFLLVSTPALIVDMAAACVDLAAADTASPVAPIPLLDNSATPPTADAAPADISETTAPVAETSFLPVKSSPWPQPAKMLEKAPPSAWWLVRTRLSSWSLSVSRSPSKVKDCRGAKSTMGISRIGLVRSSSSSSSAVSAWAALLTCEKMSVMSIFVLRMAKCLISNCIGAESRNSRSSPQLPNLRSSSGPLAVI